MVMSTMLAEIKSRMLLPKRTEEDDEEDPRAELIRRLRTMKDLNLQLRILTNYQGWVENQMISVVSRWKSLR